MARGLNKVILIGNVGHNPEMRYTPGGKWITSFTLAAPRNWTTAEGERHEETEWFNIVAWGNLAETCKEQLTQGARVFVVGRLQSRTLDDPSGKRQRSEIVAHNVLLLAPPANAGTASHSSNSVGLNCIMLIGNLGRDPEMRYTPSGKPVTCFTLATSRTWLTADGDRREETEWFNIVSWGNLAEICNRYLGRGSRVYIEGRLQTREWQDTEGLTHSRIEVVADEMIRLDMRIAETKKSESNEEDEDIDPFFPA